MNRRVFLKALGLAALFHHWLIRDLFAAGLPVVAVAEGADHARITRNALAALGGMGRFVKPGATVVVKPNMGWDRSAEYGANTSPVVVRAIVEECLKAGAKKVKVFDRTCNDERRCYVNSGIEPALKGMKNVEVKHLENERYKNVVLNGKALKEWELYGEALAADVYINVPVAKHHGLSRLTLGLKNVMGIMGGNRGCHPQAARRGPGRHQCGLQAPSDSHRRHPDPDGPRPPGGRSQGRQGAQQGDRLHRYRGGRCLCHHPVRPQARGDCGHGGGAQAGD